MIDQRRGAASVVGISEYLISQNPDDVLITFSLGSCLGLTAWDNEAGVGGLIHCMLPMSRLDMEKSRKFPAMFVDSGVTLLFNEMFQLGAKKKNLVIKAAGCSQIMDPGGRFNIGLRNLQILKKLLEKNRLQLESDSVGGSESRTLSLDINTGLTLVKIKGEYYEL